MERMNEKLLNELEKALTDEAYDGGMGALSGEEFSELVRTLAVTAVEVFEKLRVPTGNEKLIEQAAKAMRGELERQHEEKYDGPFTMSEDDIDDLLIDGRANILDLARAALAVFEKAHTPTDDEREALADLVLHAQPAFTVIDAWSAADAIVAAGFRRSEVPEPSETVAELERQIQKLDSDLGQEIDRREELHDIADRLSWAIAPVSEIGEHSSANDPWENAIEYAEARVWAEPQGEPSDALLSNVSINGVRQTWQQLYESEREQHVALQGYRGMLADLDRNASGRHEGDYDSYATGNGGISAGNPHLATGQTIGYDIGGRAYVVPEPRDRGTLSAWLPAVTEQGENTGNTSRSDDTKGHGSGHKKDGDGHA